MLNRKQFKTLRGHTFIDKLPKDPTFLDLGANHGIFSKKLLRRYPEATAILVEANPNLGEELENIFTKNTRVTIIQAAIGINDNEQIDFHLSNHSESSSLQSDFTEIEGYASRGETIKVPMITLATVLAQTPANKADLVKMDIEGAEWDVLPSFTPELYKQVDQLSVEFHDFMDVKLRPRTEECIETMKKLGYELETRSTNFLNGSPYFDCLFYKPEILGA